MGSVLLWQVILTTIVACASAQSAAKYPAGVDPNKCPNFPICDNAALHNQAPAAHNQANHWNAQAYQAPAPQPQWNQWNPQPAPQQPQWNQWNSQPAAPQWQNPQPAAPQWNAPSTSGGDKFPAGVSPQSCPNYPYCDAGHSAHHAGRAAPPPLQGFTERLYPAGVSPQSCPNYPEC